MGQLLERYKSFKEKTKGIRDLVGDMQKIAYDVSKNNPIAKEVRKQMKKDNEVS